MFALNGYVIEESVTDSQSELEELFQLNYQIYNAEIEIREAIGTGFFLAVVSKMLGLLIKMVSHMIKLLATPLVLALFTSGPKIASTAYALSNDPEYVQSIMRNLNLDAFRRIMTSSKDPASFITSVHKEIETIESKIKTITTTDKQFVDSASREKISSKVSEVVNKTEQWFRDYVDMKVFKEVREEQLKIRNVDRLIKHANVNEKHYIYIPEIDNLYFNNIALSEFQNKGISVDVMSECIVELERFMNNYTENREEPSMLFMMAGTDAYSGEQMRDSKFATDFKKTRDSKDFIAGIYERAYNKNTGSRFTGILPDGLKRWIEIDSDSTMSLRYKMDSKGIIGLMEKEGKVTKTDLKGYLEYLKQADKGRGIIEVSRERTQYTREYFNKLFFDGRLSDTPQSSNELKNKLKALEGKVKQLKRKVDEIAGRTPAGAALNLGERIMHGDELKHQKSLDSYMQVQVDFIKNHVSNLSNTITQIFLIENMCDMKLGSELKATQCLAILQTFWSQVKNDLKRNPEDYNMSKEEVDEIIKTLL